MIIRCFKDDVQSIVRLFYWIKVNYQPLMCVYCLTLVQALKSIWIRVWTKYLLVPVHIYDKQTCRDLKHAAGYYYYTFC